MNWYVGIGLFTLGVFLFFVGLEYIKKQKDTEEEPKPLKWRKAQKNLQVSVGGKFYVWRPSEWETWYVRGFPGVYPSRRKAKQWCEEYHNGEGNEGNGASDVSSGPVGV